MTFKMSLISNIFPQQRKNPFNSSKLPEDQLSQQTKSEPSTNGKADFFQTPKEGKYYFYGLDIFIFVICGLREILRVPLTKITSKGKWKVLMVFLFYYAHWFPAWGKEAEILETGSSCIPVLELTLVVWPPGLGFPLSERGNFWPEAFSHSFHGTYWISPTCRHTSCEIKTLPQEKKKKPLDNVVILWSVIISLVSEEAFGQVCGLIDLSLCLKEFYHYPMPLWINTRKFSLFQSNCKKIPQALNIGQGVEN